MPELVVCPFAEIDVIFEELNRKKKWIHNWKPEPPVDEMHPITSMTGVSQFSQLAGQSLNEQPSESLRYPGQMDTGSRRKR